MSLFREEINRILSKIQRGDSASKEILFQKTCNHLKVIARRYLYDQNDIEDCLSNAYLRVFRYIHTFDQTKDGYNWLCKIVQREAYSLNNKKKDYFSVEEISLAADNENWLDQIIAKDEIARLFRGYSKLDIKMLYLRFWEDLSYAEIAERLGLKKITVYKRIMRILKELQKRQ